MREDVILGITKVDELGFVVTSFGSAEVQPLRKIIFTGTDTIGVESIRLEVFKVNTVVMNSEWSILCVQAHIEGLYLSFYGDYFLGKIRVYSRNGNLGDGLGNGVVRAPGNRTAGGWVAKKGQDDAVWILAGDLPMMQVLVVFMGKG